MMMMVTMIMMTTTTTTTTTSTIFNSSALLCWRLRWARADCTTAAPWSSRTSWSIDSLVGRPIRRQTADLVVVVGGDRRLGRWLHAGSLAAKFFVGFFASSLKWPFCRTTYVSTVRCVLSYGMPRSSGHPKLHDLCWTLEYPICRGVVRSIRHSAALGCVAIQIDICM